MTAVLQLTDVSKNYGSFQAVRNLSFEVERGTICGFLGPNGAGKTSTIRMILGLQGDMLEQMGLGHAQKKKMKDLSKGMAQKVQLIASVVHQPEFVILDEPFSGLDPMNQQGLEAMIRSLAANGATVLFSTHVMQHAERLCDKVVLLARGQKAFEGTVAEARATSARYLEIEGMLDVNMVAALPGVGTVETLSDIDGIVTLKAALVAGAEAQHTLRAAFVSDLDVRRFQLREPTLHDAFIALTGDHPDDDQRHKATGTQIEEAAQ